MRKSAGVVVLVLLLALSQAAQMSAQDKEASKAQEEKTETTVPPKEQSSVTEHTIQLNGRTVPYKATAGTILIKNDKEQPTASVFYVAYTRSDVKDPSHRPVSFLYNGGPGSSTVWLHMGAFGPRRVVTVDAEPTPPAPYQIQENANSLLDSTDLVFIDAVGTGFSHAVGKAKNKDFWGIDQDVKAFAQFITEYVSRNDRWNSPKYLIGESYGTFRSAALGRYLQHHDNMDLNGIVLISTVLDLGTISFPPGSDLPYVFYLPSYAATAWYHKMLRNRPAELSGFLEQARQFAAGEYATALMKGSKISPEERAKVIAKLSEFTGLSPDYLSKANLRVNLAQFMEELQRSKGETTGRLDSRFTGPMLDLLGEYAAYDPQETAISSAFTAAFNDYVRTGLKFHPDRQYVIESQRAGEEWDWKRQPSGGRPQFFPGAPNVEHDLAEALASNTHLRVQVENGIYDMATPFFATEYTMDHLGLPSDLRSHIQLEYYDAGHMMYLHEASLAKLRHNIASFIAETSK